MIGIAWYREDQWELLKSTAADPNVIEESYLDWLTQAKETIKKFKQNGFNPVEVDFDVEKFNKWCQNKGKIPDGESRSKYVIDLLKIKYNKG